MQQYKVLTQCYVPVGTGLRFKKPGQIVTLDDEDAASLGDRIAPVGVQPLNTKPKTAKVKKAEEAETVQPLNTPEEADDGAHGRRPADGAADSDRDAGAAGEGL